MLNDCFIKLFIYIFSFEVKTGFHGQIPGLIETVRCVKVGFKNPAENADSHQG